jgi:ribosomal protein L18E
MPLIRRLPKRGFNNAAFHKNYAIVNLDDLNGFKEGTVVNEQLLRESHLIRGRVVGLKILGGGELKHGLTIEADKVSVSAREKIEKAGGTVTMRERPKPNDPRGTSKSLADETEKIAPVSTAKKQASRKGFSKKKAAARKGSKPKAGKKS